MHRLLLFTLVPAMCLGCTPTTKRAGSASGGAAPSGAALQPAIGVVIRGISVSQNKATFELEVSNTTDRQIRLLCSDLTYACWDVRLGGPGGPRLFVQRTANWSFGFETFVVASGGEAGRLTSVSLEEQPLTAEAKAALAAGGPIVLYIEGKFLRVPVTELVYEAFSWSGQVATW